MAETRPTFAWQDLKRRQTRLLLAYIPGFVALAVLGAGLSRFLHSDLPFAIALLTWVGMCLVLYFRLIAFRCPRCGHRFFVAWFSGWGVWSRSCPHCGLKKWSVENELHGTD